MYTVRKSPKRRSSSTTTEKKELKTALSRNRLSSMSPSWTIITRIGIAVSFSSVTSLSSTRESSVTRDSSSTLMMLQPMISKKSKVTILKSTKVSVKVPSPECIQSSLWSMEKLETHQISLDNKKMLAKILDSMISLRINSCSYSVTIPLKMIPFRWLRSKCSEWKKIWITPWMLMKTSKITQICWKSEPNQELIAKLHGLETKELPIWREKVFNTSAINMIPRPKNTNSSSLIHSFPTISN